MEKQYDAVVVGADKTYPITILIRGESQTVTCHADKKFSWVHPCCSYPLSDVTLDVPVIG